ncbi:MAG TPA: glycosyltransferase family 2 protein [Solirubrobacteraceae bacterium]|nr:glycosyltransferase family 2 protein [Solirubrobacteraceae bacterium]
MSVVIASWNAADVLDRCLESLRSQEVTGGFETIVVDNASTDGTQEVLGRHADHVRALVNARNEGFALANNRGAGEARGAALFFLNNDTELLSPDVLERLAQVVEQPGVAIAGPMLVNPDGTLQPSCAQHPSVTQAVLIATGLHRLLPDPLRARVAPTRWSHSWATDTGWVKGAALAVRADVFRDLGGFWPTLFGEEQDLAFRAQRRGLRVRFEPSVRVMHIGNQTVGKRHSRVARGERIAHAELLILRTHYPRLRALAIRAVVAAGFAARAAGYAALGRRDRAALFAAMTRVYRAGSAPG